MLLSTILGADLSALLGEATSTLLGQSDESKFGFLYFTRKLIELAVIARAILRPHRDPASRVAWVVVIAVVPFVGVLVYLLLGETNIGRRRVQRSNEVLAGLPTLTDESISEPNYLKTQVPEQYEHLFRTAHSISGFPTVGGNTAQLFSVSDQTIASMVSDIDAAQDHVHLIFYIWLTDNNGCRVVEALKRAASRGVTCRAMADHLGSRQMISSEHWTAMNHAGVHLGVALPIGNPLFRPLHGRIDLRNHRKIVVIDDRITYCGSQNCADAEFRPKPKYAPWVDAVMRFTGPVARQNQFLFVSDWMTYVDEDLAPMLLTPVQADQPGFPAQAFGTGPTVRNSAMPEMFESLMFAARREIVITTPYYVPDESMQNALCAAARRGVDTTIVFPARNDSFVVAAASRSYYADLLAAGVKIQEYVGGLLHTKSFTIDGMVTLIGSANMDRRSFDLNYENNILLYDLALTADMRRLQDHYISKSNAITQETISSWPLSRRLWNNTVAMLGPVL